MVFLRARPRLRNGPFNGKSVDSAGFSLIYRPPVLRSLFPADRVATYICARRTSGNSLVCGFAAFAVTLYYILLQRQVAACSFNFSVPRAER